MSRYERNLRRSQWSAARIARHSCFGGLEAGFSGPMSNGGTGTQRLDEVDANSHLATDQGSVRDAIFTIWAIRFALGNGEPIRPPTTREGDGMDRRIRDLIRGLGVSWTLALLAPRSDASFLIGIVLPRVGKFAGISSGDQSL